MIAPTIHHGDCRSIMPTLPRGTVITDPPYNVGYDYDGYSDNMPLEDYLSMIVSVCQPPCVIIHYAEAICQLSIAYGQAPDRIATWIYNSNTPRQSRHIAWWGCKPDFTKEPQPYRNEKDKRIKERIKNGKLARCYDWWDMDQVKNVNDEKFDHPCQIPLAIMRRIIKITEPQLVIDPFCGTGTTLLAAQELGIPSIGIELNEKYCEIAKLRTSPQLAIVA